MKWYVRLARVAAPVAVVCMLLAIPGCVDQAKLSPQVRKIVESPEFEHSPWGILVVDLETGKEVYEKMNAEVMLDPASNTKLFTAASALQTLGHNYRFDTPVYEQGSVDSSGRLEGNLVLVASGDLVMGGRGALSGKVEYTYADHTDANALGFCELTEGDPLAGLDDLARQVASSGVRKVSGDVVIDDRLFGPEEFENYVITPIIINDNLIDLVIKPGQPGEPASVEYRPSTSAYTVSSTVRTSAKKSEANIEISSPSQGKILVEGQVPAGGGPVIRTYQVEDPAAFARSLFIEALDRAGVEVEGRPGGPNSLEGLPPQMDYAGMGRAALLTSPPFSEYAKLVLKVSHNLGADTFLFLMAVAKGGRTLEDGLQVERRFLEKARVNLEGLMLNDGQGSPGACLASPASTVQLLRYMSRQPGFAKYRNALPVLGVDGSLEKTLPRSQAKGRVQAKTGTHMGPDLLSQRMMMITRALGGYMKAKSGKELAFSVIVSNVGMKGMDEMQAIMDRHAAVVEKMYLQY